VSLIIARLKNSSYVLFSGSQAMDTICATLKDYFEDYQFLKPKNFKMVIEEAQVLTGCFVQCFGFGPGSPDTFGIIDPGSSSESESSPKIGRNKCRNIMLPQQYCSIGACLKVLHGGRKRKRFNLFSAEIFVSLH
jgi:hypothetical protein